METVRKIVELGLAKRDEAGIKVRQPLQKLEIRNLKLGLDNSYIALIKDEVNVKEVIFKKTLVSTTSISGEIEVNLNTKLTPELKQEGIRREVVRFINALRKICGLTIKDRITIYWESKSDEIRTAIQNYQNKIMKDTLANGMTEGLRDRAVKKEVKINESNIIIGIVKRIDQQTEKLIKDIDARELHKIIKSGRAEIIDVRESKEYNVVYFKNSKLIPMPEARDRFHKIDQKHLQNRESSVIG